MEIPVVFENSNLLIIDKPAGLVVHEDGKNKEYSLAQWIMETYPEIINVGEDMFVKDKAGCEVQIRRPGIVHRLDRDTTGCLVIAKTQDSFDYLKELFKNRDIKKSYLALVYGIVKDNDGVINVPIGKSRKDFRMKQAGSIARGTLREARTHYRVVKRYQDLHTIDKQKQTVKYSLLELHPETGRTHQIRVHLKHINHPIVSDLLYAGKRKPALHLERMALHSHSISFADVSGERIFAKIELPFDIERAIELLEKV